MSPQSISWKGYSWPLWLKHRAPRPKHRTAVFNRKYPVFGQGLPFSWLWCMVLVESSWMCRVVRVSLNMLKNMNSFSNDYETMQWMKYLRPVYKFKSILLNAAFGFIQNIILITNIKLCTSKFYYTVMWYS